MVAEWFLTGVYICWIRFCIFTEIEKLETVYASLTHITNQEVDDGFTTILTFEGGTEVLVEVGTNNYKKAGLVDSTRGAGGGYRLGRPAAEISVGDVLRVLEGSLETAQCSGMEDESTCENHDICVTKYVWKRINDSITQAVDTMMLDQLIEESRKKQKEKM